MVILGRFHGLPLDWSFDESLIPDYASPAIVVFDDDELNPSLY